MLQTETKQDILIIGGVSAAGSVVVWRTHRQSVMQGLRAAGAG